MVVDCIAVAGEAGIVRDAGHSTNVAPVPPCDVAAAAGRSSRMRGVAEVLPTTSTSDIFMVSHESVAAADAVSTVAAAAHLSSTAVSGASDDDAAKLASTAGG